jgi:hypothetical protein
MDIWRMLGISVVACGLASCQQGDTRPKGRGSDACNDWQRAFCDFAERCSPSTASTDCIDSRGVTCSSDSAATTCAKSLGSAPCGAVPTGCGESDLADRAAATKLCNDWIAGLCAAAVRCGGSADSCVLELQASVDCKATIGVKLELRDCLETLPTLACGANRPTTCNDVVLLSP